MGFDLQWPWSTHNSQYDFGLCMGKVDVTGSLPLTLRSGIVTVVPTVIVAQCACVSACVKSECWAVGVCV